MPRKNKNSQSRNGANRSQTKQIVNAIHAVPRSVRPPRFDPNMKWTLKRRFTAVTDFSSIAITAAQICEAMAGLVCVTTNALANAIVYSVRIKEIEMWGGAMDPATSGGRSNVSLIWASQSGTPALYATNIQVADTSTSNAYCPYIRSKPPRGCAGGFWQTQSVAGARNGTTVFVLGDGLGGTVIDMTCELVAWDAGKSQNRPSTAITVGTQTAFAYLPLDGLTGVIRPVDVDFYT